MSAFRALLRAEFMVFLRDRSSMVFTFLFPILFILIFGALMGGMGSDADARLGLYVDGASRDDLDSVLRETPALHVTEYPSAEELRAALLASDVDFGMVCRADEVLTWFNVARSQENYAYEEMANGILERWQLRHQNLVAPTQIRQIVVGGATTERWLDQVVPGILAFSILSSGLFAVAGHITGMKRRRLLERLIVTPMRPAVLIGAIVVVRLFVVIVSTLLSLMLALLVYRLALHIDWLRYTAFLIAATLGSMGMGTAIALLVRSASSASNIANILSMTMMFLAGIYFPVEIMPAFFRAVSRILPLTHMADAMRYVTGVAELTEARFWTITGVLLVVGLTLLPLLSRYVVRAERR